MECISNLTNNDQENDDKLMFFKYFSAWISIFVIIAGILANSITIVVLMNKKMARTSTNLYLVALSFSNIISLSLLFLMIGLRFTLVYPYLKIYCFHWYENWVNLLMPYLSPINNLFQLNGIYLTVSVSVDWYFLIKEKSIRRSFKRKWVEKKTLCIIICIFTFCVLFTLPNWFLYKSENSMSEVKSNFNHIQPTRKLITSIRTSKTNFGDNKITKNLIHIYFYIPFVFCIPVLTLLIVNFLIIKIIIKVNRRKKKLGNSVQIDRSITVMLVFIVILFLIGQIPIMISHIISSFTPDITTTYQFVIFHTFSNIILCLNLSCNFGLYCIFNDKFRKRTKYMFYKKIFCKSETLRQKLSQTIIKGQQQRILLEPEKIEDNTQFELTYNLKRNVEIKKYSTNIQLITTA